MSTEPRFPRGSLVFVTGATGFIGATVSEELLKRGYRVRGSTRNEASATQLVEKFDKLYGNGKFEVCEIKDYDATGIYDSPLEGVSGIVHTVTDGSFSLDFETVVSNTRRYTLDLLEAAAKCPTIKAFVLTSSAGAATTGLTPGENIPLSKDSFAEWAWEQGKSLPDTHPAKGNIIYWASKGITEKAAYNFCRERQVAFAFNSIIPVVVLGPAPNPAVLTPSTNGMALQAFNGDKTTPFLQLANPSVLMVDVRDTAILHVAALLSPDVAGERLWAYGHVLDIDKVLQIWRDAFPHKKDTIVSNLGCYVPAVRPDVTRSEELLQRFAGRSWNDYKDTLIEIIPK